MLRWPIIIDQSCGHISDKRGRAVASCRAWIKSRICFRGEGESDGGSLSLSGFMAVYTRRFSLLRRGAWHTICGTGRSMLLTHRPFTRHLSPRLSLPLSEIWKFYLPSPGICVQKALREMAHLKAT